MAQSTGIRYGFVAAMSHQCGGMSVLEKMTDSRHRLNRHCERVQEKRKVVCSSSSLWLDSVR